MVKVDDLRAAIFREYKNIADLCCVTGIPRATIDNIMKGRCEPSKDTIDKICKALKRLSAEEKFNIFFP